MKAEVMGPLSAQTEVQAKQMPDGRIKVEFLHAPYSGSSIIVDGIAAPQQTDDYQKQYSESLEWLVMISGALRELVALKKIKDEQGKTADYEDRQPKAWYLAFQAIELLDKDGGYFNKLTQHPQQQAGREAMAFAEWIKKNYVIKKGGYIHKGDFYNNHKPKTTADLYALFTSQQGEQETNQEKLCASENLSDLLRSHNLKPETTVIIKEIKK